MRKAVIGGTGLDTMMGFSGDKVEVKTPYGDVSLTLKDNFIFLPRHGEQHAVPPHMINYRANIMALKQLEVDQCVGIYAVGSITPLLKPGKAMVVSDFLDLFASGREHTFFTGGEAGVKHVSMETPFDRDLENALIKNTPNLQRGGVYAMTDGPRLESKAEIKALGMLGADYVGMTLGTEVVLLKELGIKMAAIAYSINWAAGIGDGISFIEDAEAERIASALARSAMETLLSR